MVDLIAPERAEIPGGAKIPKHSPGNVTPTSIRMHFVVRLAYVHPPREREPGLELHITG